MYGLLYKVAGKYGIIDTEDGVIERLEKDTVDQLVANGVHIAGVADGNYIPKVMYVKHELLNYGANNANIFTFPMSITQTEETEGKFSIFVPQANGKKKEYKGSFYIRDDNSKFGWNGAGVQCRLSIGVITVIPVELFNSLRANKKQVV